MRYRDFYYGLVNENKTVQNYSSINLDGRSVDLLIDIGLEWRDEFGLGEEFEYKIGRFPHHMSITMGYLDGEYGVWKDIVGENIDIVIDGIGYINNDKHKAMAFRVDKESLMGKVIGNDTAHVTVMVNLKAGGKPIHSNFITEWIDLNKFVVSGVVVEKNGG